MQPFWLTLLIGLLVGSVGFASVGDGTAPALALLPVAIVVAQQVFCIRYVLQAQSRKHIAVSIICLVQALWYFLPFLFYGIDPTFVSAEDIFQEGLFLRAEYGMLTLVSGFQMGIYSGVSRTFAFKFQKNAVVKLNPTQSIILCGLLLTLGVTGYYFRPDFSVDEFDHFLQSYGREFMPAANRASSIALAGGIVATLAVREFFLGGRFLPLICALFPLYNAVMLAVVNGRRQVIFQFGSMLLFGLVAYARNPFRILAAVSLPILVLFATAGVFRSAKGLEDSGESWVATTVVQPIHELSQTASYHARLLHSQSINGPLLGGTYLENVVYAVPLISYVIGAPEKIAYYHQIILDTVDWAGQFFYTMGSSFLSELYANFDILAPVAAVALGWAMGRLMSWLVANIHNIQFYLYGCLFFDLSIWSTRCSFGEHYGQMRFIVIIILITKAIKSAQFMNRRAAPSAIEAGPTVAQVG